MLIRTLLFCMLLSRIVGADSTKVLISWDANAAEDSVTGYRVWWGPNPGQYLDSVDVSNVTEFQLTVETKTIYWAVSAYNDSGESELSGEVMFPDERQTKELIMRFGESQQPPHNWNLRSSVLDGKIRIDWDAYPGADHYLCLVRDTNTENFPETGKGSTDTIVIWNSLDIAGHYFFKIIAEKNGSPIAFSNELAYP